MNRRIVSGFCRAQSIAVRQLTADAVEKVGWRLGRAAFAEITKSALSNINDLARRRTPKIRSANSEFAVPEIFQQYPPIADITLRSAFHRLLSRAPFIIFLVVGS